jgi:group I intron endonuclease
MFDDAVLCQKNVVYCFRNKITGKVYIGKTVKSMRTRWKTHHWHAFSNNSPAFFHRALRKYGEEAFELSILATATTNDELCRLEKKYIQELQADNADTGYNLTSGGEGSIGYHPSKETRLKLSRATSGTRNPNYGKASVWRGKPLPLAAKIKLSIANSGSSHPLHGQQFSEDKIEAFKSLLGGVKQKQRKVKYTPSEETRRKISLANRGKVKQAPSEETRRKIRLANRGKVRSEESRQRYRESKTGAKNPQFGKPGTKRGTKWIHQESGKAKMVPLNEVPESLNAGWLLGMGARS